MLASPWLKTREHVMVSHFYDVILSNLPSFASNSEHSVTEHFIFNNKVKRLGMLTGKYELKPSKRRITGQRPFYSKEIPLKIEMTVFSNYYFDRNLNSWVSSRIPLLRAKSTTVIDMGVSTNPFSLPPFPPSKLILFRKHLHDLKLQLITFFRYQ